MFGAPLHESLKYASVQISTANTSGELYVWGDIPVVVAKWCVLISAQRLFAPGYAPDVYSDVMLFTVGSISRKMVRCSHPISCCCTYAIVDFVRLNFLLLVRLATEVEGTFRVNGSNKRMRDLQALFENPPKVRLASPRGHFTLLQAQAAAIDMLAL